jgi:hypothetical protein
LVRPRGIERTNRSAKALQLGGSALEADLLGGNGFDHLRTVVVQGRVERDVPGNITIAASGVFVRK